MTSRLTQLRLLAFICTICSSICWAQTESDAIDAARLSLAEDLYQADEPYYREALANTGLTRTEVDAILSDAFDQLAACLVGSARIQAREQGIPVRLILKSISDVISDEESKLLAELDWDALHAMEKSCSAAFDNRMAPDSGSRK